MKHITMPDAARALLVLPHLQVQNANAISGAFTHGFPSITAFTGLMWALQRKLTADGIPLRLQQVGVICHRYDELVTDDYIKKFRLTRNPVKSDGKPRAIVEEGRMHLHITLVFQVSIDDAIASSILDHEKQYAEWADKVGEIVSRMRVAGGTLLPVGPMPGRRTKPWMAELADSHDKRSRDFARWRRQWLPGYALIGRDDILKNRHDALREKHPDASLIDAWLHAARFNYQPMPEKEAADDAASSTAPKRVRWADPDRQKGEGWTVPIPVGYAALTKPYPAGSVENVRDPSIPCVFVETVYSIGQWISPHRLNSLDDLLWRAETNTEFGLYRCRSGYVHDRSDTELDDDDEYEFD